MSEVIYGLKHALSNAPVLTLADPDEHFELVCDASDFWRWCCPHAATDLWPSILESF